MELITFRKLTEDEKLFYLTKAAKENRLKWIFDIKEIDWKYIEKQVVYAGFYAGEIVGFYYFYNLNENTCNIAFGYFGKFSRNVLVVIRHCLKSFRTQYGIIGEVNELNTATIRLCRTYLEYPQEFIMEKADKNNTNRHIFYWQKTTESEVKNG
jgi:hypothetical protein